MALPTLAYRVDVHCHLLPDFSGESLKANGITEIGGLDISELELDLAVGLMNRYGIRTQVVSVSEPGVAYLPTSNAPLAMARKLNHYLGHRLVDTDSAELAGRFGGFAVLPLGDATDADDARNAAPTEAERAVKSLTQLKLELQRPLQSLPGRLPG